jgi:predicted SprT family Zn-dependent metalloprotease
MLNKRTAPVIVKFDRNPRVCGWIASACKKTLTITYRTAYVETNLDRTQFLRDTVIHEAAHLIHDDHSQRWKALCLAYGGDGKRLADWGDYNPTAYSKVVEQRRMTRKPQWYLHCPACGRVSESHMGYVAKRQPQQNWDCGRCGHHMDWVPRTDDRLRRK